MLNFVIALHVRAEAKAKVVLEGIAKWLFGCEL